MIQLLPTGLTEIIWVLLALMLVALLIAIIGLALIFHKIRDLDVPEDAGFFTTMHYIPLILVILLDLLDFGLDVLAAPISWIVLDRMGLRGLRNKAAIEAFIPFTQPIPVFTLGWVVARSLKLGDEGN
ncbi:hypothetical protein OSCT_0949 [Oscillochloris trichoides DG-6]|uniref:Uncharacterized protein n=1 Tax=Oscillochloris trichoides DG-6 TaxID=765420 RepID=E1IC98_9CHLR|nr:hypothetical protein [Oscillochloris trichoides]EFO81215.1 hypothetical protein OSCT_0949 [Oscillochloris trichoides DG-6]